MFLPSWLCCYSSKITPELFISIIPNTPLHIHSADLSAENECKKVTGLRILDVQRRKTIAGKKPPAVLIIDDSLVYAKLVSKFMQKKGFNTMVAIDGQEGLECIGTLYFDLVISDIHMPKMDGLEFVKILRKKYHSAIPVILYSTDIYQYNNAILAGATDFIGKPFTRERLYDVVKKISHLFNIHSANK